jgi:hypothetical protein
MKTTKTIIAAVLVLLTSATFAQVNRGLFATVKYSHDLNRFETWVAHIGDRISHKDFEKANHPLISQTFYTEYAEISVETEGSFEQWMATPFEDAIIESEPVMEEWMILPFETPESEDELYLEEWMCQAFKIEESENDICLEEWMSIPFETDLVTETTWMAASNQ